MKNQPGRFLESALELTKNSQNNQVLTKLCIPSNNEKVTLTQSFQLAIYFKCKWHENFYFVIYIYVIYSLNRNCLKIFSAFFQLSMCIFTPKSLIASWTFQVSISLLNNYTKTGTCKYHCLLCLLSALYGIEIVLILVYSIQIVLPLFLCR